MESYRLHLSRYEVAYLSVMLETWLDLSDRESFALTISVSEPSTPVLSIDGESLLPDPVGV